MGGHGKEFERSENCVPWPPIHYVAPMKYYYYTHTHTQLNRWILHDMTAWVFHARLFHSFLEHGNFWYRIFSQGSVGTYARYGGIFSNHFVANLPENLLWKNFTNWLRFDKSYCHEFGVSLYMGHGVLSICVEILWRTFRLLYSDCLQCFGAVGWTSGRAFGL